MDESIGSGKEEMKEARLIMALIKDTGFRISCAISGKNTRELPKSERKAIGKATSQFIAQLRNDEDFDQADLYLLSWLDPENGTDLLAPTKFYERIGLDMATLPFIHFTKKGKK